MLDFTRFWCFRLNALSRKVSRLWTVYCVEAGVTSSQSFIIFDLWDNDGSSVKDICIRVELDSSAVTGLIDRLEKEKLVERRSDPNDRRGTRVFLTEKGKELAEKKLIPAAKEFNKYLRSMIEPEIGKIFQNSMELIDQKLAKAKP